MAEVEEALEVRTIKHRLSGLRIPIESFIDKVIRVYHNPGPIGFDFECSNTKGLIAHLALNLNFGFDNKSEVAGHIATLLAVGSSYRQVHSTDSLHFEISKTVCNIHLDKVQVALERDEHGVIIYDAGNLLQHLVTDHLNHPNIIAPNSKDGLVFGFRFWLGS